MTRGARWCRHAIRIASALLAAASFACGSGPADPSDDYRSTLTLESVSCNDGCSPAADIVGASVGTDDRSVWLRADRTGGGSGRSYSLTYKATDSSGNVTRKVVQIIVPHNN